MIACLPFGSTSMEERFREQAQLQREKLEFYEQALQSKQLAISAEPERADLPEGMDVLFHYIIGYEHNYLAWCQSMLQYLEQRKRQHADRGSRGRPSPAPESFLRPD